jgi:anaerobic magnesium-protoporphyrin IX monomethyl ester cyclase
VNITLIAPPLMDFQNGVLTPISMDAVRTCPPYGVYLLASILKNNHHSVSIIDLIAQGSKDLSAHWPLLLSSHLIGIGASSLSWPTARDVIAEIRLYNKVIPIVLGGIHATMFDRYVLSTTEANYVIRGEAEAAFPQLCQAIEQGRNLKTVGNLTYKLSSGKVIQNRVSPKLTEQVLAEQPLPDYACIPMGVYTGLGVESSRGCPFDCIFCSTSYRKSWRGISPGHFVDKIERLLPLRSLTTGGLIQIIDDEFSLKTDRAIEICREIGRRNLDPKLVFDARAKDLLEEEFLDAIMPYTQQFLVGAECGYDEGLRKIGKGLTTDQLEQAGARLKKHHLAAKADFSFVMGLPWETKADVIKTVRFAFKLYSEYGVRVLLQWYCQIPGSRLWEEQRRNEVLHEAHYDHYGFFRDHYLFRTGVKLKPSEIHEVHEIINSLKTLATKNIHGMDMIQNSTPDPILQLYPQVPGCMESTSLANLRDIAGAS